MDLYRRTAAAGFVSPRAEPDKVPIGVAPVLRRRVLIIFNPAAGGRRSAWRLARVVAALARQGCAATVRHTSPAAGDTERLAREAEPEFDAIVAAGGDGTLNAVLNGIAGTGRPLALLPFGTANVVAHEIGLPGGARRLAATITSAPAGPVWPGRVGDRLFLAMASSGFDSETVAAIDPKMKRRFGRLTFAWVILASLPRYRTTALSLSIDGVDHHASTVIAANGRCYAGPFIVAPEASLGEPVLDFVLFQRSGRGAVLRYLAALFLGALPRRHDIEIVRGRSASLSAPGLPVQADGEIVGRLPTSIAVADHPVNLIQPV